MLFVQNRPNPCPLQPHSPPRGGHADELPWLQQHERATRQSWSQKSETGQPWAGVAVGQGGALLQVRGSTRVPPFPASRGATFLGLWPCLPESSAPLSPLLWPPPRHLLCPFEGPSGYSGPTWITQSNPYISPSFTYPHRQGPLSHVRWRVRSVQGLGRGHVGAVVLRPHVFLVECQAAS